MKVCIPCGYVEYWGNQEQLLCPNCEERFMQILHTKLDCSYAISVSKQPGINQEARNADVRGSSERFVGQEESR